MRYATFCRRCVFCSSLLLLGALQNAHGAAWEGGVRDGWVLVGTVVSPLHPKAVFQHGNGTERILIQGDVIAECIIGRIDSRSVSLICGDQHRRITLDYKQHYPVKSALSEVPNTVIQQSYSISRTRLFELVRDRQRLVGQISLVPEIKDDTMVGYRVSRLKPGGDFAGLGLRADDVITAVNGAPANQPEAFVETVNASGQMQVINVELQRADGRVTINYVLD